MIGKALSGELSCPCDRSCNVFLSKVELAAELKKKMHVMSSENVQRKIQIAIGEHAEHLTMVKK